MRHANFRLWLQKPRIRRGNAGAKWADKRKETRIWVLEWENKRERESGDLAAESGGLGVDAAVVAGAGDVESVSASGTAASRLPSSRSFPPGRPPPLSSLLLFLFVVISVVGQVWALWAYRSKINTRVLEYFFKYLPHKCICKDVLSCNLSDK